ncbi:hypothetical protein DPMN_058784 [Dreissena polymorpha]|uniref:Uncharacterized protein n=1 Tax=Dreissena polymorpha TaxID=45954 RepID=A0A9D4C2U9_DREPO|nr:hypothetical protein DPMN_058784 [Dreissena polymorpha]
MYAYLCLSLSIRTDTAGYMPTCASHLSIRTVSTCTRRLVPSYPSEQTCLGTRRLVFYTPPLSIRTDMSGYMPTCAFPPSIRTDSTGTRRLVPSYPSEQTCLGSRRLVCPLPSSSIHQNRHVWAHAETRAHSTYPSEQTRLGTRRLVPPPPCTRKDTSAPPSLSIRTDKSGYTPSCAAYQSEQTSQGTRRLVQPSPLLSIITDTYGYKTTCAPPPPPPYPSEQHKRLGTGRTFCASPIHQNRHVWIYADLCPLLNP